MANNRIYDSRDYEAYKKRRFGLQNSTHEVMIFILFF